MTTMKFIMRDGEPFSLTHENGITTSSTGITMHQSKEEFVNDCNVFAKYCAELIVASNE